jgi:hypothetical protein
VIQQSKKLASKTKQQSASMDAKNRRRSRQREDLAIGSERSEVLYRAVAKDLAKPKNTPREHDSLRIIAEGPPKKYSQHTAACLLSCGSSECGPSLCARPMIGISRSGISLCIT